MMYQTEAMSESTVIDALAIDGAQPAWMTLNAAREIAFTGEIVFESDPDVHAYLDNGVVYYAERVTDATLGRRLLDAGVLDMIQLERGTVRVGDIEHLGRLFDRDSSVDRDAVTVLAENATQELITDLANRAVTTVRATAYRHHPSGVHRWFVAPTDPASVTRPVGVIAQIDNTVVSQLPGLPFGSGVEELTIEWDDQTIEWDDDTDEADDDVAAKGADTSRPDVWEVSDEPDESDEATELIVEVFGSPLGVLEFANGLDALNAASNDAFDTTNTVDLLDDAMLSTLEVVFDAPNVTVDAAKLAEVVTADAVEGTVRDEFTVVWPDVPEDEESSDDEHAQLPEPALQQAAVVEAAPVLVRTDDGNVQFVMPPLTLSDEPEIADADVPEDVAAAVRSVIAAIEAAGFSTPSADAGMTPRPDVAAQLTDNVVIEPTGQIDVVPAGFRGFSPPTMATRAEVLYDHSTLAPASMAGGPAAPATDDPSDRSSALRRLIGSLRRKDH